MVARKFVVRHEDSSFDVDYDTEDGLQVSSSLTLFLFISINIIISRRLRCKSVLSCFSVGFTVSNLFSNFGSS
ncbi:hypothetical protein ARALYDRAFT_920706 [Arabidopsis lyrata subsp. lyrata]|uniref:Uncharacterized protein n=1 Tax=Arabidopsis lyrata subsp. lyrata TaxID=81972 RepID=D7MXM8_ARALL|nr:hypothetical protein ARALYDRAFT_920706 [Arabidopsis lyrata subsp. lyrata]